MPRYNTINIPGGGYESAQQYYGKLKKQFLQQLENSMVLEGKKQFKVANNQIIQGLITDTASKIDGKEVNEILNDIFSEFAHSGELALLKTIVDKKLAQEDQENIRQSHEARVKFLQSVQESINQQIGAEHFSNLMKKTITRVIDTSSYNIDSNTLHDLVNRANVLFRIAMSIYIQGYSEYNLNGITSITLQGYLREQAELNGLKKLFKNSPLNITHGGSVKVAGKETEFDIILSFMDNIDRTFNQQVTGVANLLISAADLEKELLPKIQYYGEQVKSFNLKTNKKAYFRIIGSRENLLTQLKNKSEIITQNGYITQKDNLSFLAEMKNIIATFGPATVLFSSGAGRQWMDEFIRDFRKENYLLTFQRKKGEYTPTVGLNRFNYVNVT